MRKWAGLAAAATILFNVGTASAAQLADGLYDCTIGSAFLGSIRIDGDQFSGPAYDGKFEGSYQLRAAVRQ